MFSKDIKQNIFDTKITMNEYTCIDMYTLYNLYNGSSIIIDFRKNPEYQIDCSLSVSVSNYMNILEEFPPDNLNNIAIIGAKSMNLSEIIRNINEQFRFRNYHFFDEDEMINLYKTFPIIFNGSERIYPSIITYFLPRKVFLGSVKTVSEEFLNTNGIDRIINMCFSILNTNIEDNFPIDDDEEVNILEILSKTYTIMDNHQNILVVCEKAYR
jgi:hypothetical protein